jgi:pimeloyl-ACP methyl ester carboxylesterase
MQVQTHYWQSSDHQKLAYRSVGEGPTVILLHGLFSDSFVNWVKFGHAELLAARGRRVVMPDLRAHGLSAKPHEESAYPGGILARDLKELVAHLELTDQPFDLGGFSLGSRTVVQAVGEGLTPRRSVLGGSGLEGLLGWIHRKDFFVDALRLFDTASRGDPHWLSIQFMKTMKVDRIAAGRLLAAFESARPEWLDAFTMPTAVVCGTEDEDNGSAVALADRLPNATYIAVPGTHMSSVTKQEFGQAFADFLTDA